MTEQELLEAIKESAQDLEIPQELAPEQVREKLEDRKKISRMPTKRVAQAAAVVALAVGMTAVAGVGLGRSQGGGQRKELEENVNETTDNDSEVSMAAVKHDAGNMFVVAKSESQVYDMLKRSRESYGNFFGDEDMEGSGGLDNADDNFLGLIVNDESYSRTNVQTEGVDESDIIKTDGNYIYTVCENGVVIVDISGETMEQTSAIALEGANVRVREMYVSGDILNLIVEQDEAVLEREESAPNLTESGADRERKNGDADVFYLDAKSTTHLVTYDISQRKKPVLVGNVSQDGYYCTSRKIEDIVYLFTREYRMNDIPRIAGQEVAYDCIYLPQQGGQGLVVSSVDVKQPGQIVDNVVIFHNNANVYVSTDAMYLYQSSWESQRTMTQIAKFSLNKGEIDAVDAATVKGMIYDTFAINQGGGQLRVLTTDRENEENVNHLFLFDRDMKLTGSLQGLARGEQVYAARFLGNMAYFVTYRNTDPLFAVDLSDAAEPKVLSELKITGFSEYLHFWGKDKLLGIGYETDPETGRQLGIKLSMFDISDPAQVTVQDSIVLEELDMSPALYEYKTVLADSDANLFGFVGQDWEDQHGEYDAYYLYQWGEAGFERLLKEKVDYFRDASLYRGLYSGTRFYLAGPDGVTSYDRADGYRKTGEVNY